MHKFPDIFYPTFFLLQLNPTYMKRILHFKNITFKSSYNWFKIDIHQQLRPLTANYWAMFKVISTTIYTWYKAQTKCKTRFHSQGMILNGFKKIISQNRYVELETPPPLHGKKHLKFPFWILNIWIPALRIGLYHLFLQHPGSTLKFKHQPGRPPFHP